MIDPAEWATVNAAYDATADELRGYLYALHGLLIAERERASHLERVLEYEAWLDNERFRLLVGAR